MDPSRNGSELTTGQKALRGFRLHRDSGMSQAVAATIAGSTERQVQAVGAVLGKLPELEEQIAAGEITLNAAQVAAGYRQHKPVSGRGNWFGKGDKWVEVANPLLAYLAGWKNRGYQFTHLPPKEAEKRVKAIDEIIAGLQEARADLVQRSVRATSSLASR